MYSFDTFIRKLNTEIENLDEKEKVNIANDIIQKFNNENIGKCIVLERYDGLCQKCCIISSGNPSVYHGYLTLYSNSICNTPGTIFKFIKPDGYSMKMKLGAFNNNRVSSRFLLFDDETAADLFVEIRGKYV